MIPVMTTTTRKTVDIPQFPVMIVVVTNEVDHVMVADVTRIIVAEAATADLPLVAEVVRLLTVIIVIKIDTVHTLILHGEAEMIVAVRHLVDTVTKKSRMILDDVVVLLLLLAVAAEDLEVTQDRVEAILAANVVVLVNVRVAVVALVVEVFPHIRIPPTHRQTHRILRPRYRPPLRVAVAVPRLRKAVKFHKQCCTAKINGQSLSSNWYNAPRNGI